jgi:hypothetical protein
MKRIISGLLAVALVYMLSGCSTFSNTHIHIVCQDAGTTSITAGGNTAGQQILSVLLTLGATAAKGATFMAPAPGANTAATAQSKSYIDDYQLTWFGPVNDSCTTTPPPTPPTTTIISVGANGKTTTTNVSSGQVVVMPPPTQPQAGMQPVPLNR